MFKSWYQTFQIRKAACFLPVTNKYGMPCPYMPRFSISVHLMAGSLFEASVSPVCFSSLSSVPDESCVSWVMEEWPLLQEVMASCSWLLLSEGASSVIPACRRQMVDISGRCWKALWSGCFQPVQWAGGLWPENRRRACLCCTICYVLFQQYVGKVYIKIKRN